MTKLTLSPAQIEALNADRLSLIVVPLDPQPDDCERLVWNDLHGWCWISDEHGEYPVSLPYTIGQRIPTPHGDRIVTDVQIKRVQDVDNYAAMDAGFRGFYTPEGPNSYSSTDGQEPAEHFGEEFTTQHGQDAWDRNLWCAFCTVEKDKMAIV